MQWQNAQLAASKYSARSEKLFFCSRKFLVVKEGQKPQSRDISSRVRRLIRHSGLQPHFKLLLWRHDHDGASACTCTSSIAGIAGIALRPGSTSAAGVSSITLSASLACSAGVAGVALVSGRARSAGVSGISGVSSSTLATSLALRARVAGVSGITLWSHWPSAGPESEQRDKHK